MIEMLQAELPGEGEARMRRVGGGRETRGFFLRPPRCGESVVLWESQGHGAVKTSPVVRILSTAGGQTLYLTTESGTHYRWEVCAGIPWSDSRCEASFGS